MVLPRNQRVRRAKINNARENVMLFNIPGQYFIHNKNTNIVQKQKNTTKQVKTTKRITNLKKNYKLDSQKLSLQKKQRTIFRNVPPVQGPYIYSTQFNEDYTKLTIVIDNTQGLNRERDNWVALATEDVSNINDNNYNSLGGEIRGWAYVHYTYGVDGRTSPPADLATQGARITHTLNFNNAVDGEKIKIFLLKNEYKSENSESESNYVILHTKMTSIYKNATTLQREKEEAAAAATAAAELAQAKRQAIEDLKVHENKIHFTGDMEQSINDAESVEAVGAKKQKALDNMAVAADSAKLQEALKRAAAAEKRATAAEAASAAAEKRAKEAEEKVTAAEKRATAAEAASAAAEKRAKEAEEKVTAAEKRAKKAEEKVLKKDRLARRWRKKWQLLDAETTKPYDIYVEQRALNPRTNKYDGDLLDTRFRVEHPFGESPPYYNNKLRRISGTTFNDNVGDDAIYFGYIHQYYFYKVYKE
jgi:hypothetical protein